ncbi:MAG: potassium-transporting ATPase subunit KdpA [Caldilineaceae bacterium]
MVWEDWLQILLYFGLLIGSTPLLGRYMANVFTGKRTLLSPLLQPLETGIYRLAGVDPSTEMCWSTYLWAMLAFNGIGFLGLLLLLLSQGRLPLNPAGLPGVDPTWLSTPPPVL